MSRKKNHMKSATSFVALMLLMDMVVSTGATDTGRTKTSICPVNGTSFVYDPYMLPMFCSGSFCWRRLKGENNYTSEDGRMDLIDGYMSISSEPFEESYYGNSGYESARNYMVKNNKYGGESTKTLISASISGYCSNVVQNPFSIQQTLYPDTDARLASGGLFVRMRDSGMRVGFVVTNEMLYVFYQRDRSQRKSLGNYAAFRFLVPIKRRKPSDWHEVEMLVDTEEQAISFRSEGELNFSIPLLGIPLNRDYMITDWGGEEETLKIAEYEVEMGTTTFLDSYSQCYWEREGNGTCKFPEQEKALIKLEEEVQYAVRNYNTTASYDREDTESTKKYRAWGQGSALLVKKIVYTVCVEE